MKLVDKLTNNIRFDKKYVFFSIIIVILGIITGSLFIVIINSGDKNLVIEYISTFIDNIKNSNINNLDILKNSLITNIFILLIFTEESANPIFRFEKMSAASIKAAKDNGWQAGVRLSGELQAAEVANEDRA